jgi:hypothetical protein
MGRVRAADDFEAIRLRLEELCRERARRYVEGPLRDPASRPSANGTKATL